MQVRLLRHATCALWLNGVRILTDPMLSLAGAMDPVENAADGRRNPLVELPFDDDELLRLIGRLDGVLVTHLHRDHFDPRAAEILPKTLPILCQPPDADRLAQLGFHNSFGRALRSAAALIKADVGVEAIQVDIGGWDTHQTQNPLNGLMATLMTSFAGAIGAFWPDVLQGNGNYSVTLVAMSEFGRNVRENGSQGTDHGRGSCMFVMGKQIAGGRVYTKDWQPLARENLQDSQDVKVTIDHRDVLAEIVKNRLGNNNLDLIFPGYTPTFQGVTR